MLCRFSTVCIEVTRAMAGAKASVEAEVEGVDLDEDEEVMETEE
jgi:hypothetical protein